MFDIYLYIINWIKKQLNANAKHLEPKKKDFL